MLFKLALKSPYVWATFERRFISKNFKKLPNLVTLIITENMDFFNGDKRSVMCTLSVSWVWRAGSEICSPVHSVQGVKSHVRAFTPYLATHLYLLLNSFSIERSVAVVNVIKDLRRLQVLYL